MKVSGLCSLITFLLFLNSSICLAETDSRIEERERIISQVIVDVGDRCVSSPSTVERSFFLRANLVVETYLVKVTYHGALSAWSESENIIEGSPRQYTKTTDFQKKYFDMDSCEQARKLLERSLTK